MLAFIVEQILLGLKFMHKKRHQVHRDFKPSNLLLDHSGKVMLTDFGVATTLQSSEALCGTFVGTYMYMSVRGATRWACMMRQPERFQAKPYSFPSDIWSLGLIVMEWGDTVRGVRADGCRCALGEFPLAGSRHGYWDVMMRIVQDSPPTLPAEGNFSSDIRDFVSKW